MRAKDRRPLIKVGFFVICLVSVAMVFVVLIGKEHSLFESKIQLRAYVPNAANLKSGAFVELKGIRVGTVDDVRILSFKEIELTFTIQAKQLQWIRTDSKVAINTAGLVGDKYLEIISGSSTANAFDPRKDILAFEDQVDVKKFINKGENIADQTKDILAKVDLLLTQMQHENKLNESLKHLYNSTKNFDQVSHALSESKLKDTLLELNKTSGKLSSTMDKMDKVLDRIQDGPGTLNSMIYDDGLYQDLRKLLGGAERSSTIKYFIRESIKKATP